MIEWYNRESGRERERAEKEKHVQICTLCTTYRLHACVHDYNIKCDVSVSYYIWCPWAKIEDEKKNRVKSQVQN